MSEDSAAPGQSIEPLSHAITPSPTTNTARTPPTPSTPAAARPARPRAATYRRNSKRRRAYGESTLMDAAPAVAHLRALQIAGLGHQQIAARAGVSATSVSALLYGRTQPATASPRRARVALVEAILAVPMPTLDDYPSGTLVPAIGARRRLRALASLGWSASALASRSRLDEQALNHAMSHQRTTASTHRAVRDLFAQLWNTSPLDMDASTPSAVARTRARAERLDWPMPLDLDEEVVDDPAAPEPTRSTSTPPDSAAPPDLDEWGRLVTFGEDPARAAARCGATAAALERAIYRNRPDLRPLLRRSA
jgi:hypothetical protein